MRGRGVYIRRLDPRVHGTPDQAAAKAKRYGVNNVFILAVWQDIHEGARRTIVMNSDRAAAYAAAFREEGIRVWVWGYPRAGGETAFVAGMKRISALVKADGWLLDPEVEYKFDKRSRTRAYMQAKASKLMRLTAAALTPDQGLAVTSYPLPSGHPTFPWEEFLGHPRVDVVSPQIYTLSKDGAERAIGQYRQLAPKAALVVSSPAYGKRSGFFGLKKYFAEIPADVDGVCMWSWRQMNRREWDALAKFSPRFID